METQNKPCRAVVAVASDNSGDRDPACPDVLFAEAETEAGLREAVEKVLVEDAFSWSDRKCHVVWQRNSCSGYVVADEEDEWGNDLLATFTYATL